MSMLIPRPLPGFFLFPLFFTRSGDRRKAKNPPCPRPEQGV